VAIFTVPKVFAKKIDAKVAKIGFRGANDSTETKYEV
jgi:hypothetical protein